jgi:hypothetical protein
MHGVNQHSRDKDKDREHGDKSHKDGVSKNKEDYTMVSKGDGVTRANKVISMEGASKDGVTRGNKVISMEGVIKDGANKANKDSKGGGNRANKDSRDGGNKVNKAKVNLSILNQLKPIRLCLQLIRLCVLIVVAISNKREN